MNAFEKKLNEIAAERSGQGQAIINDAKALLSQNAANELKVLHSIGLDHNIKAV